MADVKQLTFSYKEIAEALVRHQGLHEGIWGVYVEFGIAGGNIAPAPGADLLPAAIVPVVKFGLQRFPELNSLSVDAAIVNPAPARKKG
jgi:hypothetical protein